MTLTDGERRGPVRMAGATAHGSFTRPFAFQVFDEPAELWGGSVANEGHDCPISPTPPSLVFESIL